MCWSWSLVCLALLHAAASKSVPNSAANPSVQLFQRYLQINTTTSNDLSPAVEFWRQQAKIAGVELTELTFKQGPVLVLRWPGADSTLRSIMLNSHMDVVPADEAEGWTYPPFSGHLDEDGVIWGRGTQDMKSVSIQYLEAMKRVKSNKVRMLRDVYMTLMPDEENGGNGMQQFLLSKKFKQMNIGLALDEGAAAPMALSPVFYQDKSIWQIQVDCYGVSIHGSMFPATNETATGMCRNVINKMFEFRDSEYEKYLQEKKAGGLNAGVYTSVNLDRMNGGTANNIIPSHISLVFDIRLGNTLNEEEFEDQLNEWIKEAAAGGNVTLTFLLKNKQSPATKVSSDNPYWATFSRVAQKKIVPIIPSGATDSRFVRLAGYPAFGFAPMPSTPTLLHAVNERLNMTTFLNGIDTYAKLIPAIANIPKNQTLADPSTYNMITAE